jgi:hypothetical protein
MTILTHPKNIAAMRLPWFFLFLVLGSLFLGACRKDKDDISDGPFPVVFVRSAFYGVVSGAQDQPLSGVTVTRGAYATTTDANGYFFLPDAPVDSRGGMLRFTAPGYFDLVRTVLPQANRATPVEVKLSPRTLSGSVSAMQGGTVGFSGVEITFPAQGFLLPNGQSYTGAVQVYGTFLDPSQPDMQCRMPGNLSAVRTDGRGAVLATFGMIGVELATPAGEPLQLAPGSSATIRVPLTPEFRAAAPPTIPLWHFDEQKGRWIEEGQASLEGFAYVGEVSHFSFWNLDLPFVPLILKGRVIAEGGSPVVHGEVRATIVSGGGSPLPPGSMASAITDGDGRFTGWVPAGAVLKIEVRSPCNQVLFTQEIGPLNTDHDMGTLLVEWNNGMLVISAQLQDCADEPLAKPGYLRVRANGRQWLLPVDDNGQVNGLILACEAMTLEAAAFDPVQLKQGQPAVYPISGLSTLDLGVLKACDALTEYLQYDVDGLTGTLLEFYGGIDNGILSMQAYGPDSTTVNLSGAITLPGSVFASYVSLVVFDPVTMDFHWGYCPNCTSVILTVEELGPVGALIKGNFTGTIPYQGNPNVPFSGSFQFIRDY